MRFKGIVHKTALTSDTNCLFGGFLEPCSGLIVYQKDSASSLKAVICMQFIPGKVHRLKLIKRRDAKGRVWESSKTKLLLSLGHVTLPAYMYDSMH